MAPSLNHMGLESKQALRKAIANYKNLPINCLVYLSGKTVEQEAEAGFEIYEMTPSGDFILQSDTTNLVSQPSN